MLLKQYIFFIVLRYYLFNVTIYHKPVFRLIFTFQIQIPFCFLPHKKPHENPAQ